MLRNREEALLDFCQAQRVHFDPEAWLGQDRLTARERAAAAAFLGRVDWYGHQAELLEIAARLAPDSGGDAIALAREVGLSFSRFSQTLKARLAHKTVS